MCEGDRYVLVVAGNQSCVLCNGTFQFCVNCTAAGCLACGQGYRLVGGNCVCQSPDLMLNGTCFNCSQLYGQGCTTCDVGVCLGCASGFALNFNGSGCVNCSVVYGSQCLSCDAGGCLWCGANFSLNAGNCVCAAPGSFVLNGTCFSCDYYPHCLTCNSSGCLSC
jgi:hypothetical protein